MAKSYQVRIKTSGSSEYTSNGVYLPDAEQATNYAKDIARRWSAYVDHQIKESDQAPNYTFDSVGQVLDKLLPTPVTVAKAPPVKRRQKMRRVGLSDSAKIAEKLLVLFGQRQFADWYERRFVPVLLEEGPGHPESETVKQELIKLVKNYVK